MILMGKCSIVRMPERSLSQSSYQEAGTVLVVDGLPPCGGAGPWLGLHH